ncbi:MAG: metal-sulfur cluster assembly factor [Brockia lithotrophica]|nr:metal-sulfur cluster assembly factor [Brockia lithotrophica]MBT9252655.1 metal-sulfur cluster assembly factor [Brockia lithotrophica]
MYEELQLAPIAFVGPFTEEEKNQLIEALMGVVDPEIGMDIVNLGLVYELHKDESGRLKVVMTLTAVGCPLAPAIVGDVRRALLGLEKYSDVEVELAYSPPWDRSRLSRVAKMALGLY